MWWVVAVLVVALTVTLAWWRPWQTRQPAPEDGNSASPSVPSWDESSLPTEPPEPTLTAMPTDAGGRPVACPVGNGKIVRRGSDGRYASGGLSFAAVPGWGDSRGYSLDMANDIAGQSDPVVNNWIALTAIGWLDIEQFGYPKQAARQVLDCLSTSYYYRDLDHRKILESRQYDVGGRPGWIIRADLVNKQPHAVVGDEVIVLVVDTGRPDGLAVFHTEAPIGDARRIDLTNAALASVQLA